MCLYFDVKNVRATEKLRKKSKTLTYYKVVSVTSRDVRGRMKFASAARKKPIRPGVTVLAAKKTTFSALKQRMLNTGRNYLEINGEGVHAYTTLKTARSMAYFGQYVVRIRIRPREVLMYTNVDEEAALTKVRYPEFNKKDWMLYDIF